MKFAIRRTSQWDDKQPCEDAVKGTYTRVDERTVDDPKKLKYIDAYKDWFSKGENHRVDKGHIKRDFPNEKAWFVTLKSLKALMEFQNKYGTLVIDEYYNGEDLLSIEIYDDYRE